ncbi:MAG: hypothetical protein CMI31_15460 [Opitutae bacterium]|nr:hypothetical protein [Opitutae bacterium]|tara:strand:+ start:164 stop:2956 length:2793 start_codon:yes stop_codon:yes gene_type:complete
MRVPNVTTSENLLDVIKKLDQRQLNLQKQISDGQSITLPEDDGMKMGRLVRMETEKNSLVQYQRNASYATEYLNASHLNLDKLRELGVRSQELARTSGSGLNYVAMETNAQEMNQLLEEALNRINATHRKKALFGGTYTTPKFGSTDVIQGQRFEKKLSLADNYIPENLKVGDKFTFQVAGQGPYVIDTATVINDKTGDVAQSASAVAAFLRDKINADNRKTGIQAKLDVQNNLLLYGAVDEDFEFTAEYETDADPEYEFPNDTRRQGSRWTRSLSVTSSKVSEATNIALTHPADWQRLTSYNRGELVYYNDKIWESQTDENFNRFPDTNLAKAWKEVDSTYDVLREDWNLNVSSHEYKAYNLTPDGWLFEDLTDAQNHVISVLNQSADVETPQATLDSMYTGISQVTMSVAQFEAIGSESAAARVSFDPRTLEYTLTASANGENVGGSKITGNLLREPGTGGLTNSAYQQNDIFVYDGQYYKALQSVPKEADLSGLPSSPAESTADFLNLGKVLPRSGFNTVLDSTKNQSLIKGEYLHDLSANKFYFVLSDFTTDGDVAAFDPSNPTNASKLEEVSIYESPQGLDWNQGRTYNTGDIVYHKNRYWQCLQDNFKNLAFDPLDLVDNYLVYPDDEYIHNSNGDLVQNDAWLPIGESFGHVAKFRADRSDWPEVIIAPPTRGGEGAEAEAVVDASGRLVGLRLTKAGSYTYEDEMPQSAVVRTSEGVEITVDVIGDNGKVFGFKMPAEAADMNLPTSPRLQDTFSFATGSETFLSHRNSKGEVIDVTYNGNEKNAETYIGKGSKISYYLEASNGGTKDLGDVVDSMISLRDALRNAKPSTYATEVEAANQKLIALEDKVVDKMGEVAAKMARMETVQKHDEEYFMGLDQRIAKDIDVDLSEAIVRMTRATTAYQAAIQVGAHMMNTSLLNFL